MQVCPNYSMNNKLSAPAMYGYPKLLTAIQQEMNSGLAQMQELYERQKAMTCWTIGRHINTYLTHQKMPRGTIGLFYQQLSKDLGVNSRSLVHFEQFFRYFPKFKPQKNLSWSHYRYLLLLSDAVKRQRWIERIKKENISSEQLRLALMTPKTEEAAPIDLKESPRGRLFTYRLKRASDVDNFEVPWFIDLGFADLVEAPASAAVLDNKRLYTTEKIDGQYRLKVSESKSDELFTYRAILRRVVDGDTLIVLIDKGLSSWTEQRLRLRAIDAPEANTLPGDRAKQGLEDELKGLPFIIVKTYKDQSDNWDRYLCDIFYQRGEKDPHAVAAEGLWLNGRMLEAGMAKIWKK